MQSGNKYAINILEVYIVYTWVVYFYFIFSFLSNNYTISHTTAGVLAKFECLRTRLIKNVYVFIFQRISQTEPRTVNDSAFR